MLSQFLDPLVSQFCHMPQNLIKATRRAKRYWVVSRNIICSIYSSRPICYTLHPTCELLLSLLTMLFLNIFPSCLSNFAIQKLQKPSGNRAITGMVWFGLEHQDPKFRINFGVDKIRTDQLEQAIPPSQFLTLAKSIYFTSGQLVS